jgi:nucleoside phosphorylase
MKLLTFAHSGEAQAFLTRFPFKALPFFFDGLLKCDDYYLLITGEGPHSASEKTTAVLSVFNFEITHVYNLGVAGSLNEKIKKDDLIWVRTAYAHHAENCVFKSFTSSNKIAVNDCITAYVRVLDLEEKKKLSQFANIVDRELWAVASAAQLFKKPFLALKIISDDLSNSQDLANREICQFVKEEAPMFSEKLLSTFLSEEQHHRTRKTQIVSNNFLDDPDFYFTTSQERKLLSTTEGLRLKGLLLDDLIKHPEIVALKEMEKLPKERTRLLLVHLSTLLNPISVKIRASLQDCLLPLIEASINPSFDPEFEEDYLNLSIKIQSSRELEQVKNALKIFSYEEFKAVFEGKF